MASPRCSGRASTIKRGSACAAIRQVTHPSLGTQACLMMASKGPKWRARGAWSTNHSRAPRPRFTERGRRMRLSPILPTPWHAEAPQRQVQAQFESCIELAWTGAQRALNDQTSSDSRLERTSSLIDDRRHRQKNYRDRHSISVPSGRNC